MSTMIIITTIIITAITAAVTTSLTTTSHQLNCEVILALNGILIDGIN
jgi:hypothetical protein